MRSLALHLLLGSAALVNLVACGGDDKKEPAKAGTLAAGAACDPSNTDTANSGCVAGTTCEIKDGDKSATCLVKEAGPCDPAEDHCGNGLVCEDVDGGDHRCYGPVVLHGEVLDASDRSAIAKAQVLALNDEGVAVTDVAVTDAMGNYDLQVPTPRNDDGSPTGAKFTLRAAAQDYLPFPSGARVALPIDVADAVAGDAGYVVESALTEIDLIPLPAGDRSTIEGSIIAVDGATGSVGGVLVVAKGADSSTSGISDRDGAFTIFNVAPGDYDLAAYGADIQVETKTVTVPAKPLTGVELRQLDQATATVSGSVQIVNAPGGSQTSVILVVEDTFDPNVARGEVPRGLRSPKTGAPDVSGSFSITGVPVGKYVVLAAYENDGLVRDPDTNISGTDFVHLEVTADQTTIAISDSFKITAALGTVSPGVDAPEAVTEKPMLTWVDDSSEDWYDLRVFDALGNEVWQSLMLPAVKGSANASAQYEGPLDPGMYYQFRVSSWRQPGKGTASAIATTEDLRGVFLLPAQ